MRHPNPHVDLGGHCRHHGYLASDGSIAKRRSRASCVLLQYRSLPPSCLYDLISASSGPAQYIGQGLGQHPGLNYGRVLDVVMSWVGQRHVGAGTRGMWGEKLLLHGITSSLRDDDVDAYGFLSLSFRHHRVSSLHRALVGLLVKTLSQFSLTGGGGIYNGTPTSYRCTPYGGSCVPQGYLGSVAIGVRSVTQIPHPSCRVLFNFSLAFRFLLMSCGALVLLCVLRASSPSIYIFGPAFLSWFGNLYDINTLLQKSF